MSGQTRRDWLVNITQVAAGAGLANTLHAQTAVSPALPPGVFDPSGDHLGHALMLAERYHPVSLGCPTDYVRPRIGPFQPQFFTAAEYRFVERWTQLFLGETAASELSREIAEWIDLRVGSAAGARRAEQRLLPWQQTLRAAYYGGSKHANSTAEGTPAQICRGGIAWLPGDFLGRDGAAQIEFIRTISDERADAHSQNPGTRLFDYLKTETIHGFYTSKAGLKELDFKGNAFYARSPGCEMKTKL